MDTSLLTETKMEAKKLNKIGEILKLQKILKKCRKIADSSENNTTCINNDHITCSKGRNKKLMFLKRTLLFTYSSSLNVAPRSVTIPKGFFAVCVGKYMKQFIIPTEYLSHVAFKVLLEEAEDEFGFQQEGVLRLPCDECMFESTLKAIQKRSAKSHEHKFKNIEVKRRRSCSIESQLSWSNHPRIQSCR